MDDSTIHRGSFYGFYSPTFSLKITAMINRHVEKTKRLLTKYGYCYDMVERRLMHNITRDFCGFADLLAFREITQADCLRSPGLLNNWPQGSLAIQICAYSTMQAHIQKVTLGDPSVFLRKWLNCGNRFEVWAFPSPRDGGRKPPKFRKCCLYQDTFTIPAHDETELQLFGFRLSH